MLQAKVSTGPDMLERSESELRPAEIAMAETTDQARAFTLLARDLASPAPTLPPEATGATVLDLFRGNAALPLLAITDAEGVIFGTVERDHLLSVFAQPLWFDVYFKRSIQPLMNRAPLIVDEIRYRGETRPLVVRK